MVTKNQRIINNMMRKPEPKQPIANNEIFLPNTSGVKGMYKQRPEWDDQQVNLGQVVRGSSAPTWTDYKGSQVLAFSPSQNNKIFFTTQLTHAYAEGTDIEFHIHTIHPDANSGDSKWTLTYSWANIGETFPSESTVSTLISSSGVADEHNYGDIIQSITGTGKRISSILLCSLTRNGTDAADDYASSVYLAGLDFHILKNSVGSLQETRKE